MMESIIAFADGFVDFCGENEWVGRDTLFLASPGDVVDQQAMKLQEVIGMDKDTLKYVALLLLTYPLSYIMSRLPGPTIKHTFSLIVGLWMMQTLFYSQWIHSLATSVIVYLLVLVLPNRVMPYTVFVFTMAYMCGAHIYRQYVDYMGWSLDFTGPQMLLTLKLSSFAFNVYDGRLWEEIKGKSENSRDERTLASRRKFAVRAVPGPLAYFGYSYCFASILAGPAFEYTLYEQGVTGAAFASNGDKTGSPPASRVAAAFKKLFLGLLFMGAHLAGTPSFPIMSDGSLGLAGPKVLAMPILQRICWQWVSLLCVRLRYYFAWTVSDGGANLAGFGYGGIDDKTGKAKWDEVSNIDVWDFETAHNVSGLSRAWNKRTQGWLERCVYIRTNKSLLATYFVSAFWHGFYPGYYLFFLSVALITETARVARTKLRPRFLNADGKTCKWYYNRAAQVCNTLLVNYLVMPFQVLGWHAALAVWGGYHYGGHVMLAVAWLGLSFLVPTPRPAKAKTT